MSSDSDRDLGMGRAIPRRDFVSGVGVALTGSLLPATAIDPLTSLLDPDPADPALLRMTR